MPQRQTGLTSTQRPFNWYMALLLALLMQLGSFLRIQVWKFGKNEPSARALPILKKGFGDQALSVVA